MFSFEGPRWLATVLRKQQASLSFLMAHHQDLRVAIELAGPEPQGGAKTWRRVFRDAESAVLRTARLAFPELDELPATLRQILFWRECGDVVGPLRVPPWLSPILWWDQDGLFPSASRVYRRSMNDVARWARRRGLMDFPGDDCIDRRESLIETMLAERRASKGRAMPAALVRTAGRIQHSKPY
jgi:hypothetical protein